MMPYVVSPRAETDLDEIWRYIAKENVPAADRLLDRLHQTFRMLARQPLMGQLREDLRPMLRGFVVGNYVVFYRPTFKGIEIVRVIHGARDIESQFWF